MIDTKNSNIMYSLLQSDLFALICTIYQIAEIRLNYLFKIIQKNFNFN